MDYLDLSSLSSNISVLRQTQTLARLWGSNENNFNDLTLANDAGDRVQVHSFILRQISPWVNRYHDLVKCTCICNPCPHEAPRLYFICSGVDLNTLEMFSSLIYTGQIEAHDGLLRQVFDLAESLGVRLSFSRTMKHKPEPMEDEKEDFFGDSHDEPDTFFDTGQEPVTASISLWESEKTASAAFGLHYCTFCEKRFKAKSMLDKHVKRFHKDIDNEDFVYAQDDSEAEEEYNGPLSLGSVDSIGAKYGFPGQQSWKCFKCAKLYTNFHKLKNHISSHFAEEIVGACPNSKKSCEFCKYKFTKKSDKVCHLGVRHDKLTMFVSKEEQPEIYTRKIRHREKIPTEIIKPLENLCTAQEMVKKALTLADQRPNQIISCVVCHKETREGKPYRIHLNNHFMDTLLKLYPHYSGLTCNICKVTLAKKRALGFHLGFMHDGYKIVSQMTLKDTEG